MTERRRKHAELRTHAARCSCRCDKCRLDIAPTFRRFSEKFASTKEYQQGYSAGKAGSQKPCPYRDDPARKDWLAGYKDGFIYANHAVQDKPKWAEFGEGSATLHGVEIFANGEHRGKTYDDVQLDEMVRNFRKYSVGKKPLLRVPAVLGHEETQEFLDRSDLPAAAWATDVFRGRKECPACMGEGGKCEMCGGKGEIGTLKADFADVPPKVARLLKGKTYRQVSAEIYDEPPEGIPGEGAMLRRVAFPWRRDSAGEVSRRHSRTCRASGEASPLVAA